MLLSVIGLNFIGLIFIVLIFLRFVNPFEIINQLRTMPRA
jgi:hypothetical protein